MRGIRPGEVFAGRYEIERTLGRGGFGRVYEVHDQLLGKPVALKFLNEKRWASAWDRWRESAMLRTLEIRGVPRLLDEGRSREGTYIVTELVRGVPFPGRVDPRSWHELAPLVVDLLDTLSRVHAEGIVHADIKPENVLMTADNETYLVDFGIAHRAIEGHKNREVAGSPNFMSLDIFAGEAPSPQSDLYALGVMIFEALTGQSMFESRLMVEWFATLREHGPPTIRDRCPGLDESVITLVDGLRGVGNRTFESATHALSTIDSELRWTGWEDAFDERTEGWTVAELQPFFAGPEVGWHLASRSAGELWKRTEGDPEEVLDELRSWIDLRLAHYEHGRFRVGVRALASLESGRATRDEASDRSCGISHDDDFTEIILERAQKLDRSGRPEAAAALLQEAEGALASAGSESERDRILEAWARQALWIQNPESIEAVLFAHHDRRAPYLRLVESVRQMLRGARFEHFEKLGSMLPFDDPDFEMQRHVYRATAARFRGREYLQEVVEGARAAAKRFDDPRCEGIVEMLEAYVAAEAFDFERATDQMLTAADKAIRPTARLSRLMSAAQFAPDSLDYERALRLTEDALEFAAELGATEYRIKLESWRRMVLYRLRRDQEFDEEYVHAARLTGKRWAISVSAMTEAAIAWRQGAIANARRLASEAHEGWVSSGFEAGAILLEAFLFFLAPQKPEAAEIHEIHQKATSIPAPRLRAQALILASRCAADELQEKLTREALELVDEDEHGLRFELISLDERDSLEPAYRR